MTTNPPESPDTAVDATPAPPPDPAPVTALPPAPPPVPPAAPPPAAPPAPAPGLRPMDPNDEKTWAILTHLSPLLGFVTGVLFAAPLVLYFVLKDRGPFIRHHVTESLNAILSLALYSVALGVVLTLFTVVTFGIGAFAFALYVPLGIVAAVFWVIAAVETSRGRWYRYPLVVRFVR